MNERIMEFAEQAGAEPTPFSNVLALVGNDIEKFAELIVRECQFAIVSRTDRPMFERKLYNNVLKEHFGVEE